MSNVQQLTLFDNAPLPAYLADLNAVGNIVERETVPQLSFRGKVWRVVVKGEEKIVTKPDGEPAQSVGVVILEYNKARSRAYFEGAYEEGKSAKPVCWSHDGIVPHETVADKQSPTCASCQWSVKGSRISESKKELTACAQFKRVAVVPIQDTKFTPLLLKIPQTSMWDPEGDEYAAQGFYAYDQYMDFLKRRNVNHTASVVTKVKFDARTAYPKLLFAAAAYLPEANRPDIIEQLANVDELNKLLNVDPTGTEVGGEVAGDVGEQAAAPAAAPRAATKPPPPKAAPKPAPPPPPAPPPEDEMGTFGTAPAAATPPPVRAVKAVAPIKAVKPAAAPAAPAAAEVVPEGVRSDAIAGMLASWDD
jgi:hypothetical protein